MQELQLRAASKGVGTDEAESLVRFQPADAAPDAVIGPSLPEGLHRKHFKPESPPSARGLGEHDSRLSRFVDVYVLCPHLCHTIGAAVLQELVPAQCQSVTGPGTALDA